MGDERVNETALRAVLDEKFPSAPRRMVQERITRAISPVWTKTYATDAEGPTWQRIDIAGYELLVLGPDELDADTPAKPAYIAFGGTNPGGTGDNLSTNGALPVYPGTRIKMPQGCDGFWFAQTAETDLRLVVVRLPHIDVDTGVKPLSQTDSVSVLATRNGTVWSDVAAANPLPTAPVLPGAEEASIVNAAYDTASEVTLTAGLWRIVASTDCFLWQIAASGTAVATTTGAFLAGGRELILTMSDAKPHLSVIKSASAGRLTAVKIA